MFSRRGFLGCGFAAGLLPVLGADNPRIARIGLMTDTHVEDTMESCGRVKLALELFKAKSERQRKRAVAAANEICVSMRREGEGFPDLVRRRMGKEGR